MNKRIAIEMTAPILGSPEAAAAFRKIQDQMAKEDSKRASALRKRYDTLKQNRTGRGGIMSHPKDFQVPLVSQIGQLDPDNPEHRSYLDDLLIARGWNSEWGYEHDQSALTEVIIVCFLFLEDGIIGEISPDVVTWINEYRHDHKYVFDISEEKYGEGATVAAMSEPVLIPDLQVDFFTVGVTIRSVIAREIGRDLYRFIKKEDLSFFSVFERISPEEAALHNPIIRRCEDCLSAFLITRGGQRFCSNRCGLRHGERRRRRERKKADID